MKILRDAPKPILVHCQHGSDRTGAVIALYRILFQNMSKVEAIKELKSDIEIYKIRLKNSKNLSSKAPDIEQSNTSITIKQLNIYC